MNTPGTSSSADFDMDVNDILNFDLYEEDFGDFSPFSGSDLEKELSEKSIPLNEGGSSGLQPFTQLTNQALNQLDKDMDHPNGYLGDFDKHPEKSIQLSDAFAEQEQPNDVGSQELHSTWLSQASSFDIFKITEDDPEPMETQTLNTSTVDMSALEPNSFSQIPVQQHPQIVIKKEKPDTESVSNDNSTGRPTRQRRKSVQTSRNVQDSTMMFLQEPESVMITAFPLKVETKPMALSNLNGTDNRTRHVSSSSSTAPLTPQPASSKPRTNRSTSNERKKRKYECEDDNDPSVKNAKAAKMNRDKKKRLLQDLQGQVNVLKAENQSMKLDLENKTKAAGLTEQYLKEQNQRLLNELAEEKRKNSATSMQKVKMLDYMRGFIQTIQPTPNVFMSTQLANMPMPQQSELPDIRRRMQENPQSIPNDTCLTVKDSEIDLD